MNVPSISKSKYIAGLQCPKLLWAHYNAKDWLPPVDAATQAIFDQGHKVGDLAKRRFPSGVEVEWTDNIAETVRKSQALIKQGKPLFEASFMAGGVYARADILEPVGRGRWDLIEVKSTGKVKDVHVPDLAVQRYCYETAGVPIRRCHLMHIDTDYVLKGEVDPKRLFACEDVTDKVAETLPEVAGRIRDMQKVIGKKTCPDVEIGPHCSDPYPCPLAGRCWAKVNARPCNVFSLYNLRGEKKWALYGQGVVDNAKIGDAIPLSDAQHIQITAERTGRMHVDTAAIREFLAKLRHPVHYLDFESFSTAIPLVQGTSPYQQVPFQFSLHTVAKLGTKPRHAGWIWDGQASPFAAMAGELRQHISDKGTIVAYNANFEKACLQDAAKAYPAHRAWVSSVIERMVDLLSPFRSFSVYHPAQHGSASIKSVLPALVGKDYSNLTISDGGMASQAYLTAMYAGVPDEQKRQIFKDLETYCGQDTLGMWDIVRALAKQGGAQ